MTQEVSEEDSLSSLGTDPNVQAFLNVSKSSVIHNHLTDINRKERSGNFVVKDEVPLTFLVDKMLYFLYIGNIHIFKTETCETGLTIS